MAIARTATALVNGAAGLAHQNLEAARTTGQALLRTRRELVRTAVAAAPALDVVQPGLGARVLGTVHSQMGTSADELIRGRHMILETNHRAKESITSHMRNRAMLQGERVEDLSSEADLARVLGDDYVASLGTALQGLDQITALSGKVSTLAGKAQQQQQLAREYIHIVTSTTGNDATMGAVLRTIEEGGISRAGLGKVSRQLDALMAKL